VDKVFVRLRYVLACLANEDRGELAAEKQVRERDEALNLGLVLLEVEIVL
jgi:hypothetical protein